MGSSVPVPRVHESRYDVSYLPSEKWGNGITNLCVLFGPVSGEVIVILKCLKAGCFTNCQAAALRWVVMDEVVSILRNVGDDRG